MTNIDYVCLWNSRSIRLAVENISLSIIRRPNPLYKHYLRNTIFANKRMNETNTENNEDEMSVDYYDNSSIEFRVCSTCRCRLSLRYSPASPKRGMIEKLGQSDRDRFRSIIDCRYSPAQLLENCDHS